MDNQAFEKRREASDYKEAYRSVQEEIEAKGAGNSGPGNQPVGPRSEINQVADPALAEVQRVGGVVGDAAGDVGSAAGQWGSDFVKGIDNLGAPARWAFLKGLDTFSKNKKNIPLEEAAKLDNDAFLKASGWPSMSELKGSDQAPGGDFMKAMAAIGGLAAGGVVDPLNFIPGGGQAKNVAKAGKAIKDVVNTIKSEKDLRAIVDAPGGKGKTYAILTDDAPKLPVAAGYQKGNLDQLIRKVGPYEVYKVKGSYEGVEENSFMIVSDKPNDQRLLAEALKIARDAGQESIATNEGILFPDGSLHKRTGTGVFGSEAVATKNYSVVQTEAGELPFTTPVDWGTKKPSGLAHDYTGIAFSNERHMQVPSQGMFLNELPKDLDLRQVTRFQNEVKIPGMQVYDFAINHLNLPEEGYEQALRGAGYRAAITYGPSGMPSIRTLDKENVGRVLERSRPFEGPETGMRGATEKVVFPAAMPDRIAKNIAEGNIDLTTRKDLVQMGAAHLAQPEMTSAKVAKESDIAVQQGEKTKLVTRMGDEVPFNKSEDAFTHDNAQDIIAYKSAKDMGKVKLKYADVQEAKAAQETELKPLREKLKELNKQYKAKDLSDADIARLDTKVEAIEDKLDKVNAKYAEQIEALEVRGTWGKLGKEIERIYQDLEKTGLKIEYVPEDPYKTAQEMMDSVKKTGVLKISNLHNIHPVLTPEQNLRFRAIHDYYGHIAPKDPADVSHLKVGDSVKLEANDILTSRQSYEGALKNLGDGKGSQTSGPLDVWITEDGRALLVDGQHRFASGLKNGEKQFDVRVVGKGYTDYYAAPAKGEELTLPANDFGMAGESGTFKKHIETIQGEDIRDALRAEIIGQAGTKLATGKFPDQKIFDMKKERQRLGLVNGASADLFKTWMKSFEERLPDIAKGKLSMEQYRDLFNESAEAYTKHLETTKGQIPNTKTLLSLMNDSRGRAIQEWYGTARYELDRLFGEDADLMAKFIALFSPQADVDMNVDRAFNAFRAWKLGEREPVELVRQAGVKGAEKYTSLWHNMLRTMRGEELSGRKVNNFLNAINGNQEAVTADRHMAAIFGFKDASNDNVYSFIEENIRLLARETNTTPAQAQAILWGSWKAVKGQGDELMNLDVFIRKYAEQNPDLVMKGSGLDEKGVTRLQAAWLLSRVLLGGAIGGAVGDDPGERLINALIGVGLGAFTSKPVIQKIIKALRENMPAKWFKPKDAIPQPVMPRPLTPEETIAQANAEAAQKARIDALRNKPKTVTVGEKTFELDMKALDTPESIKKAVDEMAKAFKEQLDAGTLTPGSRGVIPNALAKRLGEHLGLSENDVLSRTRGSVGPVEHVFAYAEIMDAAKARALASMELFNSGIPGMKTVEQDFVQDMDRYVQVGYQLQGLLEELGRGLQAAGTPDVKGLTTGFKGFQGPFEILRRHGSINGDTLAALVKETGLEKAAAIGKAVQNAGLWDMVAEVTYGFTLSNPRSTVVNVASSAVLNPILTMMTRNMAETFGSNVATGEARAMLFGYFSGVQRMMRAVSETYTKEGGVLGLLRSIKDVRPVGESALAQADKSGVGKKAITGANVSALMPKPFQFDPSGWLGRTVDAAGSAVRTPSMLMELGDHFSYAVNYDMAMHARAFREGVKLGKEGQDLEAFIASELSNPSPSIRQEAENFAKHEIFKQLIDGNPGKIVEGLNHPSLRPFITFVRTPVNIFRYNLEGVPLLNLALKGVREDIQAGGARRDLALAKMTLGGTMAAIAGMMAQSDRITGAGPDNYKLRQLWMIDHKPYSVKLPYTDQWVSYRYFDPVSAWFGMAADASHFMSFDKDDLTTGEAAMSIVLGLARNFTDKTYTRDTFDFLDHLTVKPGENANTALESFTRYMDKKTTTYVPFSSLSRAVRNVIDPHVREAFTLLEKVKNTIPGWSMSLPEKLDFYGDPIINPRTHSLALMPMKKDSGDDVTDELLRIRANVGMPPKVLDGEELTAAEYHDLTLMRGKGLKDVIGQDLREAIIEVLQSDSYTDPETTDAARRLMVEKTVEAYTQAAIGVLAEQGNERYIKYRKAQKRAEELTGQPLNLNFGAN